MRWRGRPPPRPLSDAGASASSRAPSASACVGALPFPLKAFSFAQCPPQRPHTRNQSQVLDLFGAQANGRPSQEPPRAGGDEGSPIHPEEVRAGLRNGFTEILHIYAIPKKHGRSRPRGCSRAFFLRSDGSERPACERSWGGPPPAAAASPKACPCGGIEAAAVVPGGPNGVAREVLLRRIRGGIVRAAPGVLVRREDHVRRKDRRACIGEPFAPGSRSGFSTARDRRRDAGPRIVRDAGASQRHASPRCRGATQRSGSR